MAIKLWVFPRWRTSEQVCLSHHNEGKGIVNSEVDGTYPVFRLDAEAQKVGELGRGAVKEGLVWSWREAYTLRSCCDGKMKELFFFLVSIYGGVCRADPNLAVASL